MKMILSSATTKMLARQWQRSCGSFHSFNMRIATLPLMLMVMLGFAKATATAIRFCYRYSIVLSLLLSLPLALSLPFLCDALLCRIFRSVGAIL